MDQLQEYTRERGHEHEGLGALGLGGLLGGYGGEPGTRFVDPPVLTNILPGLTEISNPPSSCKWVRVVPPGAIALAINFIDSKNRPILPGLWTWTHSASPLGSPPTIEHLPVGGLTADELAFLLSFYVIPTGELGSASAGNVPAGNSMKTVYATFKNYIYKLSFEPVTDPVVGKLYYPTVYACSTPSGSAAITGPTSSTSSSSSTPWVLAGVVGALVVGAGIWYATK